MVLLIIGIFTDIHSDVALFRLVLLISLSMSSNLRHWCMNSFGTDSWPNRLWHKSQRRLVRDHVFAYRYPVHPSLLQTQNDLDFCFFFFLPKLFPSIPLKTVVACRHLLTSYLRDRGLSKRGLLRYSSCFPRNHPRCIKLEPENEMVRKALSLRSVFETRSVHAYKYNECLTEQTCYICISPNVWETQLKHYITI